MNRENVSKEIIELFIRMVNKYNSLEKIPVRHGTRHNLYHSERHMLDKIGEHAGMNVTEFATAAGVTKGAISQMVSKLEKKGIVRRYKKSTNDKEVFLELTKTGQEAYRQHQEVNKETIKQLDNELSKYSDEKVEFLIKMFRWFEDYLDLSKKKMKGHHQ
jgi:DNA-binding MarR family transcriptional regulator